jgi:hypothetical protein
MNQMHQIPRRIVELYDALINAVSEGHRALIIYEYKNMYNEVNK